MGQIFDWDGTITGKAGSTIVRDQPFYTSSLCESRPNWGNMSICPHQYVAAEGTGTGYTEQGTLSFLLYILILICAQSGYFLKFVALLVKKN